MLKGRQTQDRQRSHCVWLSAGRLAGGNVLRPLLFFTAVICHQGHTEGEHTSALHSVTPVFRARSGNCRNGMQALGNESYGRREKSGSESLLNLFYVKYFHEDVCDKHSSDTCG